MEKAKEINFGVGDKIVYKTHNEGKRRFVKVTEKYENFKNMGVGFVGVGYRTHDKGTLYWGYGFQILSVVGKGVA